MLSLSHKLIERLVHYYLSLMLLQYSHYLMYGK